MKRVEYTSHWLCKIQNISPTTVNQGLHVLFVCTCTIVSPIAGRNKLRSKKLNQAYELPFLFVFVPFVLMLLKEFAGCAENCLSLSFPVVPLIDFILVPLFSLFDETLFAPLLCLCSCLIRQTKGPTAPEWNDSTPVHFTHHSKIE